MTLFLKYALPVAWTIFFGAMTIAFWFVDGIKAVAGIPVSTFRTILTVVFLLSLLFLYWSVLRIKRVEMDEHFFYVTNYFKNVRYPYHQIEKVVEKNYFLFKSIHIYLKQAATFGKKISFVASRSRLDDFLKEHPEVSEHINGLK